ncbi:UDP-glucuronic acid decarboxylase 2 [Senna tora]|uniref:UDP-glucuronic acid decarboxylase 2 n=1 Tax=Senna tora TaxID=362788 RepID=A0A834W0N6_9FABA|nr:UDP-glucuronic acid decarboxylase 2 [Senna tora]
MNGHPVGKRVVNGWVGGVMVEIRDWEGIIFDDGRARGRQEGEEQSGEGNAEEDEKETLFAEEVANRGSKSSSEREPWPVWLGRLGVLSEIACFAAFLDVVKHDNAQLNVPPLLAFKPIKASIFISQCCTNPCIEIPHLALFLPLIAWYLFSFARCASIFLTSVIVTDTPALAHLLGLLLAVFENGVSDWMHRSGYLVTVHASLT